MAAEGLLLPTLEQYWGYTSFRPLQREAMEAVLAGRDPGVEHHEETRWLPGVANLGRRPTVDGEDIRLEVHLFDFAGDLYGETLRVRLMDFIRPEKKFDGLDALKAQIALDCGQAREILAQTAAGQ